MSQATETRIFGGRYEVLDAVGHGAAALVYKVRDRVDGTTKALKLLRSESAAGAEIVRRFEEEFRVLRGLHHPSLLDVFDYGWTDDDSRYMVMEFVEGQRLDHYLAERPEDLWVILYELCEVLTFIHSHNLLHLDIKPANILVKRTAAFGDEMPLVVLIDFGLTHRRGEGDAVGMVGTPEYMAPDVIRGETPYTNAVDYYSLGVSLYELITGELPFRGSGRDVFAGHLNQEPRFNREKVEYAELYPHIRGLMSKDKRRRLESFEDFKRAVIARMTGGIHELEKAYGLARINSLGMIGKDEVWKELMDWAEAREHTTPVAIVSGEDGSGTTFLALRFESEMSIRGIHVATLTRLDSMASAVGAGSADRNMRAWDLLVGHTRRRGGVVTISVLETLDDTKRELLAYLSRRYELAASDETTPNIRFLCTSHVPGTHFSDTRLFAGRAQIDLPIRPLTSEDHARVMAAFRASKVSVSDARDLEHFLGNVGHTAGALCSSLRGALLDGALRFGAGRWQAHLTDYAPETGPTSYHEALLATLPAPSQEVACAAASHGGPATLEMIAAVAGVELSVARDACQNMRELGFVRVSDGDGNPRVTFVSEVLRRGLYEAAPEPSRRRFHSRYRELIEWQLKEVPSEDPFADHTAQLSEHLEGLGEYREALRLQFQALRHHATNRDLPRVRRSAQAAYRLCELWELTTEGGRGTAAKRYVTRTLMRCEFDETNYHRVREILQARYPCEATDLPISFATRYIRSLQSSGELSAALSVVDNCLSRLGDANLTTALEIRIEQALVLHQKGDVPEAISILCGVLEQVGRLDLYHRCRAYLHLALCYNALEDLDRVVELASTAERFAQQASLPYEISLIYQLRAAVLLERQDISGSKSATAKALRLGGKMRMHNLIRGALYHASAIYFYVGDYARCEKYLGKATRLAERLGDTRRLLTYVIRSAMIQQALGAYGNAVGLLNRGERLLAIVPSPDDEITLWLTRWDIAIDLNSENREAIGARVEALMKEHEQPHPVGYYRLLSGRCHEMRLEYEGARDDYLRAWEAYKAGEVQDDEARAVTGLVRVATALGDEEEYRCLMEVLTALIGKHPVPDVVAESSRAILRHEMEARNGGGELSRLAVQCDREREAVNSVPVLLLIDMDLFEAWRRLGRNEDARRAFDRFYKGVKGVVANVPDRETSNRFLARRDIDLTLRAFREWSRGASQ